jgi:hypothetical protein
VQSRWLRPTTRSQAGLLKVKEGCLSYPPLELTGFLFLEGHGRKRGREASVEPGLVSEMSLRRTKLCQAETDPHFLFQTQSTSSNTAPIPQKKYRIETLASIQSSRGSSPRSKDDSSGSANNDDTVKEVRQKVEDLSHDEFTSVTNSNDNQEDAEAHGIDGTDATEHPEQEVGRKRKQEERTLSSQVLPTDAKRARDKEEDEVGSNLRLTASRYVWSTRYSRHFTYSYRFRLSPQSTWISQIKCLGKPRQGQIS